jgi:hypothetical protein
VTTATQQALAVVFRRFNDEVVPRDDLVKAMSLELDWTKPSRAENLLDRGLNGGYVEERDGGLAAGFDTNAVDVPFGFAPAEDLFEAVETTADGAASASPEETPLLDRLLDRVADALGGDRNEAMAAANACQDTMGGLVSIEAAALLVAHREGVDVGDEAEQVLDAQRAEA